MLIRPFAPDDYPAVATLRNAGNPRRPVSVDMLKEMDAADGASPSAPWTRLVAEDAAGAVVGYAESGHYAWMPEGRFSVYATVREDCRGRGIGGRLLGEAERWALARGARDKLVARMRSDDPESYAWAERRGYELEMDRLEAVLDLGAWAAKPFAGCVEAVEARGLVLTVTEQPSEAELRGMYAVEAATVPDIPTSIDGHVQTWEEWSTDCNPGEAAKIVALALDGCRIVGWSGVSLPRVDGAGGHTNFTGVLREYRGCGLAVALKLLTIESTLAHGVPFMTTTVDPENQAILAVNAKLGYRLMPGPRWLKKALWSFVAAG